MCALRLLHSRLSPVRTEGILNMIIKTNHGSTDHVPSGAVVMLGYFDGFHKGHMALADAAQKIKQEKNAPCVMLWTFAHLAKGKAITDNEEKAAAFFSYFRDAYDSADPVVVFEDFSAVSHLTGEEFVKTELSQRYSASAVVCGFNFRFGKNGSSGASDLARYCAEYGIDCCVVPPFELHGKAVSSTELRQLIESGDVAEAAQRMGRPYAVTSEVVHGKRLGHSLGFPTVNLRIPQDKVTPAFGVYACRIKLPSGEIKNGVANMGSRPTVNRDRKDVTLETYIFDYNGDLYGETITVYLLRKLRDEVRFGSWEELSAQIEKDKKNAIAFFEKEVFT
ncbi:MAG: bifunctional riboflavin kinase/FAD synthetase [Ruminococcaceae bacterium]|nr:bifunctional riboflavin kinase/FAD synthetase [Oscillospiraceae bacterium]